MTEMLKTLEDLWNNSVAFANTTGVTSMIAIFVFAYLNFKFKKKNNTISIDVNQSTKEVNDLKKEVAGLKNELGTAANNINKLTDLLFTFANSTKIEDGPKRELAKIYASTIPESKPILEKAKEVIETTAEEVKEAVKETDIYEQIKKTITNK